MLRPYREYKSTYMQFLESFLIGVDIMERASEALNPVFGYLVENTTIEKMRINLIRLSKIMCHGILYSNEVIKECLDEVDRNSPSEQITVKSEFDSSSDDLSTPGSTIKYNSIQVYNRLRISESDKALF
jgi:hypothetical protein